MSPQMNKIMVLDTETTGTDPKIHSVVQIAGIVCIGGEVAEEFEFKVRPFEGAVTEADALRVTGLSAEELFSDPERVPYRAAKARLQDVCCRYVDKFNRADKLWFLGYNGGFDADMIRAMWNRCGDAYFGSLWVYPIIDVAQVAAVMLGDYRHKIANFRLGTVCNYVGIEWDDEAAHDALYDVRKTLELWNFCMKELA